MTKIASTTPETSDILIIGGGVIGVCSAYYLLEAGFTVSLVEKDQINAGSTHGNAGLIIPSDSLPVPGPGVLTQGLRWLLDASSPFYIKPTLDPRMLRWLWDFQNACKEEVWEASIPILTDLSAESTRLFQEILDQEGIQCDYHQQGLLLLYRDKDHFQDGQDLLDSLAAFDIQGEVLGPGQVASRLPVTQPGVQGGLFFEPDSHLDPARFTAELASRAVERGLRLHEKCEVLDFELKGGTIQSVLTTKGRYVPNQVVLAAGAWTSGLGQKLGLRLPIEPAKGYSITLKRPKDYPEIPLILDEAKVAVTPLGETLRLAGTLELAGLDMSVNQRRVQAILDNAKTYLQIAPEERPLVEIWRGLRPCTPDGLPVIGRSEKVKNLIAASGHCMLGVSQGTMTGKLVAQIAQNRNPSLDITPLSPARF